MANISISLMNPVYFCYITHCHTVLVAIALLTRGRNALWSCRRCPADGSAIVSGDNCSLDVSVREMLVTYRQRLRWLLST